MAAQADFNIVSSSSNLVDLNNNFEIKVIDTKKNRSLISKRKYQKGEALFTEKPLVSSQFAWNEFYNYKACENCMKPLENTLENVQRLAETRHIDLPYLAQCDLTNKSAHRKCPQCGVDYCSEQCFSEAFNTYHQAICLHEHRTNPSHPYNLLMDIWKQMHLPPETTTVNLIIKLIATVKQTSDKEGFIRKLFNFECSLVNENEQLPHKLLSEKYFNELENLREVFIEYFKNFLYVKECESWLSKEGFRQLFALFGRNSQGIGTSPFSVYVENLSKLNLNRVEKKKLEKQIDKIYEKLDQTAGAFLNSEGSGLYELQSMINHSCKPNAEIAFKFNNNVLSLIALEDIDENEEIFISYLDDCQLSRSRHSRQKLLRENYLFNCECERCVSELSTQPDLTSDDDDDYEDIEDDNEDEYVEDDNQQESMEN